MTSTTHNFQGVEVRAAALGGAGLSGGMAVAILGAMGEQVFASVLGGCMFAFLGFRLFGALANVFSRPAADESLVSTAERRAILEEPRSQAQTERHTPNHSLSTESIDDIPDDELLERVAAMHEAVDLLHEMIDGGPEEQAILKDRLSATTARFDAAIETQLNELLSAAKTKVEATYSALSESSAPRFAVSDSAEARHSPSQSATGGPYEGHLHDEWTRLVVLARDSKSRKGQLIFETILLLMNPRANMGTLRQVIRTVIYHSLAGGREAVELHRSLMSILSLPYPSKAQIAAARAAIGNVTKTDPATTLYTKITRPPRYEPPLQRSRRRRATD